MKTLCDLNIGESAVISDMEENSLTERLLDLGFSQGTRVTCVGRSPGGDPSAYLLRGTVIALRTKDARGIFL